MFKLMCNSDKQYYFHFLDSKGEIILMSGEYPEKQDAVNVIKDVQVGSLMADQIAAGKIPEGDSFFVIKDRAGEILAKSILFDSMMQFDNALHSVKDNACIAEISDLT